MKTKVLILTVAVLAVLAGAIPAGAAPAGPAPRVGGKATSAPPGGSGPQAGEIALGSFVAPSRSASGRHGAADHIKAAPGCAIQCITSGVAYGRGPDVRLVVTTDSPATIQILVSRAGYVRHIVSDPGSTELSVDLTDLEADTTYDAFVSASDGAGHLANRSGSFRTLQRNAVVVFNEAHISAAPFGDDPYTAQVWFEGQGLDPFHAGDADGGVLPVGVQVLHATDTDRYLGAGLELSQSDLDVDICEATEDPPEPEYGPRECAYANTAWLAGGELDLDARPSGQPLNNYWIAGTMALADVDDPALPGGFGEPLAFTVPLGVHVTWTLG